MDPRVLVVAQEIELRAKIAPVLQSAGYTVELAENTKRALDVAAREQIDAVIIVRSPILAGLQRELHDKVPRTIVLGQDEILRLVNESKLLDWLERPTESSEKDETHSAPVILKIKDCKLDLARHTFVDRNGREVRLTRSENALLAAFVGSPRRVLSRDQLRHAVVGVARNRMSAALTC
jgi:DNA-binding response OmpR family regulator